MNSLLIFIFEFNCHLLLQAAFLFCSGQGLEPRCMPFQKITIFKILTLNISDMSKFVEIKLFDKKDDIVCFHHINPKNVVYLKIKPDRTKGEQSVEIHIQVDNHVYKAIEGYVKGEDGKKPLLELLG